MKVFSQKSSVLEEEHVESDDSTPMDSLNGACQFAKPESSPFSSRKYMYEKEEVSDRSEVTHTSEEVNLQLSCTCTLSVCFFFYIDLLTLHMLSTTVEIEYHNVVV